MKTIFACLVLAATGLGFAGSPFTQYEKNLLESAKYRFVLAQDDKSPAVQWPAVASSTLAPRNKGKAMFMSLLVPGLGQRYAGANIKSNVFLGAEISLWLSYAGFKSYSLWRINDYENYAAAHAGVNLDGKNNTFFIDVGNFDNIHDHNAYRLQQRNFNKYYQDIDYWYWDWESQAARDKFDQLRISADTADNRATFVLGAIVANHLISAIDAVWSVHKYENKRQAALDWDVRFGDGYVQPAVNVNLTAHF